MHIPDGYLDIEIIIPLNIISLIILVYSFRQIVRKGIDYVRVGAFSAGIFLVQMLNWPIPGGTSAHFLGSGLSALILGPYLATVAMSSVIIVQALIFGDGGILSLGANIFNMAIAAVFTAYFVMKIFNWREIGAFFAGWFSCIAAAFFVGLEIGLSSSFKYSLNITIPVMVTWHAILGIIEGIITYLVYKRIGGRIL